jgi:hypothetical protein
VVGKENCDDKAGNVKDVCVKEAKAALVGDAKERCMGEAKMYYGQ